MTRHIACNDATLIPSLDGVTIAMHDFGGAGSPVLVSHATGFHAHCMEPIAHAMNKQHHVMGLDHRGYGDADAVDPATLTWRPYGGDALAAARHLSTLGPIRPRRPQNRNPLLLIPSRFTSHAG